MILCLNSLQVLLMKFKQGSRFRNKIPKVNLSSEKKNNSIKSKNNLSGYKISTPEKSESHKDEGSGYKSNKEMTEDTRGYEVINAKDFHKANEEFNQFDGIKESTLSKSESSPQSPAIVVSDRSNHRSHEQINKIPKPPANIIPKNKSKPAITKIPSVSQSDPQPRVMNTSQNKEEQKKHKGKTPSFGNSNAPLFLNNFQIDTNQLSSGTNTPSNTKSEEIKIEHKRVAGSRSRHGGITDRILISQPILSHREKK